MGRPNSLNIDTTDPKAYAKAYREHYRKMGKTPYCLENYECIENYELAKQDEFDPCKWQMHHRLENYWNKDTLKKNGMYFKVSPFDLIWLPYEEHQRDIGLEPDESIYHKHILEPKRGWKDAEKYIKCEGKHQLESDEQRRTYQREYHRQWYLENKERQIKFNKNYRKKVKDQLKEYKEMKQNDVQAS